MAFKAPSDGHNSQYVDSFVHVRVTAVFSFLP